MRPAINKCRSCGALIYWAVTTNDSAIPIDKEPVDGGNVLLTYNPARDRLTAEVIAKNDRVKPDRKRYVSHFATCPNSDRHRNRK